MLINSDQRGWFVVTVAVTAVATVAYVVYAARTSYGPSGGSWPGLAFGIAGTTAMVIAALLSARKKLLIWRLGSARAWMQAHIWLGLLAVPLILFHAGFRLGGALTTTIMALFTIVILSGIFGLVLQQFMPSMMTASVPLETIHSQIGHVIDGLWLTAYEHVAAVAGAIPEAEEERARLTAEEEAQRANAGNWKQIARQPPASEPAPGTATLKAFYLAEVRPYLRLGTAARTPPDFGPMRVAASPESRATVERLAGICEETRQLALQLRLHGWLHNWLFVHAPVSFALFVLVAFHIYFALSY